MAKFLDMDGLEYYTNLFKPGLSDLVNNSTKNMLEYNLETLKSINTIGTWTNNVYTHRNNGIFTINSDNTINVDTTNAIGNCYFFLGTYNFNVNESYVLSGCPANGSATTYFIKLNDNYEVDSGTGRKFTNISSDTVVIGVLYPNPINLTFKPMICTWNNWTISKEYIPYNKIFATDTEIYNCFQNA